MTAEQPYTPSMEAARGRYSDGATYQGVPEPYPGAHLDAWDRFIAQVKREAGRAAMLAFVEEAEKYRDLRDASDDRHSARDVDGWWYVISAAEDHIDEFHPDPEETS